jgi:hypothetical protein
MNGVVKWGGVPSGIVPASAGRSGENNRDRVYTVSEPGFKMTTF